MRHEINFVDPSVSDEDKLLFLGPFDKEDGEFVDIQPDWTMAHIMYRAGIFPSVKQAKSNGWNKPISLGYDENIVGKRGLRVITLVKFD